MNTLKYWCKGNSFRGEDIIRALTAKGATNPNCYQGYQNDGIYYTDKLNQIKYINKDNDVVDIIKEYYIELKPLPKEKINNMSLDVTIKYKKPISENHFLNHIYTYSYLSEKDKSTNTVSDCWSANITHNLGEMASYIPASAINTEDNALYEYNLYQVCWCPEKYGLNTTDDILPLLIDGIIYMINNRNKLIQYDSSNGWGTYSDLLKFLLNYKEACENNPGCEIEVSR